MQPPTTFSIPLGWWCSQAARDTQQASRQINIYLLTRNYYILLNSEEFKGFLSNLVE